MELQEGSSFATNMNNNTTSQSLGIDAVFKGVYSQKEFLEKWGHIPGAKYLLMYRPEICEHKLLLENIRNTRRVESMTLEGEGTMGYVVQISDICMKFKNEGSIANFKKELENYLLIERIYKNSWGGNRNFKIPNLQRALCNDKTITMEYIPGFVLSHWYILKDKKICHRDLVAVLEKNQDDEIRQIRSRLQFKYDNILERLKDHELRTLLIILGVSEQEIKDISILDTLYLLDYSITSPDKEKILTLYSQWNKELKKEHILSIDDHGENLKFYNNTLYSLDFGNIVFSSKRNHE